MRLLKVPKKSSRSYVALELDTANSRLFAAGDDGAVEVWDTTALFQVARLEKPSRRDIAKLVPLSTLEIHKGSAITALKWWNGQYLISSDVEGYVKKTLISNDNQIKEEKMLIQSQFPVNDIQLFENIVLAAAMNKILTYDLENSKELSPITLKSDIRGISIDPTQNYLVSIAFNKSVNVNQIQYVNGDIVTKKISNGTLSLQTMTDVSKFSWSSIGDRYALPNYNLDPDANSIGVMSRTNWKPEFSLVGHLCSVVRFNPNVYECLKEKKLINIVASAGTDKSLAVWNTTFQRPLFTASDVSNSPIYDLIWSKDGTSLVVAADSLIVLTFEPSELGQVASKQVLDDLISKVSIPNNIIEPKSAEEEEVKDEKADEEQTAATENNPTTTSSPTAVPKKSASTTMLSSQATITKSGKKRIAPTLVSTVNGKPTQAAPSQQADSNMIQNNSNTTMEFDKASYSVPKELKRREEFNSTDQPVKKKKEIEAVEFIGSVAINPSTSFAKLRISTPRLRSSFILESPNDESLSLEIKNGSGNEQKPTRITLFKNSTKQIFVDFIPKLVGLATGGEGFFWAISTVDGILHIYSDSGRRIFPQIVIGTPLSFLESKGHYLLAVSSIGEVFGWDIANKRALFEPTSLYSLLSRSNPDLLTRAENLTLCGISSSGIPIVTLSNGNGYLFDKDMGSWTLISDSWWAFGSQYWDATDKRAIGGSIINLLENKTNDEIIRRGRGKFLQKMAKTMLMKEGYENLEKTISLAHLENRILISKKLKEDVEFKNYLIIYCKRISELGYKARLQEIFQDLWGPETNDSDWDPKVLSFDKHELLKELIFSCANIRSVQRILIPFATSLNILDQTPLL